MQRMGWGKGKGENRLWSCGGRGSQLCFCRVCSLCITYPNWEHFNGGKMFGWVEEGRIVVNRRMAKREERGTFGHGCAVSWQELW